MVALNAPAAMQHGDPIAHRERFLLVVRHVNEGRPGGILDLGQLALHLAADLLVERGQRLVEQQQLRTRRERAGDRDALLLAAGELGDAALLEARKPDQGEQLAHAGADLGLAQPASAQAIGDVPGDVHVREIGIVLKDHPEMAPPGRHVADRTPFEDHLAAIGLLQTRDDPQQRGFAGAARAEKREELARLDRERHVVGRDRGAEPLADVAQLEDRRRHQPGVASSVVSIARRMAWICTSSAIEARSARWCSSTLAHSRICRRSALTCSGR